MLPIAPYQSLLPPSLSQQGPTAVDGLSARTGRQGDTPAQPQSRGPAAPTRAAASGAGVRIAGTSPSLSSQMIGVFGALSGGVRTGEPPVGESPQTEIPEPDTAGSRPIDPLTGEMVELDPITGRPNFSDPLSLARERAASGEDTAEDGEAVGPDGLTESERAEVRRLAAIDRQVRQHEAAHKAAGAGVTGPASFTYVTGPDGKQYAVGGEVSITVSGGGGDPEQTIRDMEQVQRAALAPADPSPQDRSVAAAAQAAIAEAEAAVRDQERAAAEEARAEQEPSAPQADSAAAPFATASAAYAAAGGLMTGGGTGAPPAFGTTGPGPGPNTTPSAPGTGRIGAGAEGLPSTGGAFASGGLMGVGGPATGIGSGPMSARTPLDMMA
jgi:hypothetical protein